MHFNVQMCAFLFIFFARTPKNTAKKYKKQKNRTQWYKAFSEKYEGPRTNQQINVPTIRCLGP